MSYSKIDKCRVSGKSDLIEFLSLGDQFLTGVFPKSTDEHITKGPLSLCWSKSSNLVQLQHSFSSEEMYGSNYGYRSGLNRSMVEHLVNKARFLENLVNLNNEDTVLDIGSNDGTLLNAYSNSLSHRIGIDPTSKKFSEFYKDGIVVISDFFNADVFKSNSKNKAKIVTSIAMFYDLEDPSLFVRNIYDILENDGVWHFEQSYLPSMINSNSYDTICHEHIEYYTLGVINNLLEKNDLKIVDVAMNSINGGSFCVTAAKKGCVKYDKKNPYINWLLEQEKKMGYNDIKIYNEFAERVITHRQNMITLLDSIKNAGKKIIGYGASTKGNVLLQYCGINADYLSYIVDVNKEKDGSYTPGTNIPILKETDKLKNDADYMLVLPWHFREFILEKEKDYLWRNKKLIFPFPYIQII